VWASTRARDTTAVRQHMSLGRNPACAVQCGTFMRPRRSKQFREQIATYTRRRRRISARMLSASLPKSAGFSRCRGDEAVMDAIDLSYEGETEEAVARRARAGPGGLRGARLA
jgi:hypothetical protein